MVPHRNVVVTKMESRKNHFNHIRDSVPLQAQNAEASKRLPKNAVFFAVVCLCVGAFVLHSPERTATVMSRITTEFDYDDTLGRLQFVSNILPESAMVFLQTKYDAEVNPVVDPDVCVIHVWSPVEPWLEYESAGSIRSCSQGQIMAVVANQADSYTVRILHDDGYESLYSGLNAVHVSESEQVSPGQEIGISHNIAAFELRKDGLSIQPNYLNNQESASSSI